MMFTLISLQFEKVVKVAKWQNFNALYDLFSSVVRKWGIANVREGSCGIVAATTAFFALRYYLFHGYEK